MGQVRVDGQPVHFSETDWHLERGAPCLGEHNQDVLTRLLGYTVEDVAALRAEGVL
jgi:crotonobetainyl-CoA:carnitine CoA-transferase CaiB-like acyl-CoA transferase